MSKPAFLEIPQDAHRNRARSKTLTTPAGTPIEYRAEFITKEWLRSRDSYAGQHWRSLPVEIKSHVLSFLSATDKIRCSGVNRELRGLVTDGSLWRVLDTSSFYTKIPADQLLKLIDYASPFVQELNLKGCVQLKSNTHLNLDNLTSASFEGCRFLTPDLLVGLLVRNRRLKHLDVAGLSAVNDTVATSLVRNCPLLSSLNISYCKNISQPALLLVVQELTGLKDLRIAESRISLDIIWAIHSMRLLERLCLAGCATLQDSWIKTLIYGSSDYGLVFPETRVRSPLLHLDISRCPGLTGTALQYLVGVLPRLEKIELAGLAINDSSLLRLLPSLPKLTHVDLEDCNITDLALTALSACSTVGHVQLSHCPNITDAGVLQIIDMLTLHHLDLDNTNISDRVLSAVAAESQAMRLSIYDCPQLSWPGVLSILVSNSANSAGMKRLKTFYGWQRPVDGHSKRCLRGDIAGAREIEREWATYMMESSEEVMRTGAAKARFLDFDDQGLRILGRGRGGKSRACLLM